MCPLCSAFLQSNAYSVIHVNDIRQNGPAPSFDTKFICSTGSASELQEHRMDAHTSRRVNQKRKPDKDSPGRK